MLSLPSLLAMAPIPDVRGAVPEGGLLGTLVSHGLRSGFNLGGAILEALTLFFVSLFMTTRFSFSGAHSWASNSKGPIGKMGILQRAQPRWQDWRADREQEPMRRAVFERRVCAVERVEPQT